MGNSINREVCQCCGQTVNTYEKHLFLPMVVALGKLYKFAKEKNRYIFKRAEIKHLFNGESMTATFGDWVYFGKNMIFKPAGKGVWGINVDLVDEYFKGDFIIPTTVQIKNGEVIAEKDWGGINAVKNIASYMDVNGVFQVQYI